MLCAQKSYATPLTISSSAFLDGGEEEVNALNSERTICVVSDVESKRNFRLEESEDMPADELPIALNDLPIAKPILPDPPLSGPDPRLEPQSASTSGGCIWFGEAAKGVGRVALGELSKNSQSDIDTSLPDILPTLSASERAEQLKLQLEEAKRQAKAEAAAAKREDEATVKATAKAEAEQAQAEALSVAKERANELFEQRLVRLSLSHDTCSFLLI